MKSSAVAFCCGHNDTFRLDQRKTLPETERKCSQTIAILELMRLHLEGIQNCRKSAFTQIEKAAFFVVVSVNRNDSLELARQKDD